MAFSRSFLTGIKSSLLFLFLVSGYSSYAQFSLLKDINPVVDDNSSFDLFYQQVELNGIVYFIGNDEVSGAELWRTDGTTVGTYQVKDINSSTYMSSDINYLTKMGNAIYFAANDGTGVELWKTDGTNAGTKMVKRINNYLYSSSSPMSLVAIGNTLFFSANDCKQPLTNRELWKSDGTAAGTVKVKEFNPSATEGGEPTNLINVDGKLFFSANDGTNGSELWTSDGTEVGTIRITDLSTGVNLYNPVAAKNKLYWVMSDIAYNQEVWISDGTVSGTYAIDLSLGTAMSWIDEIVAINDSVVISMRPSNANPDYGKELWVSDGTIEGSHMIKDIVPGIQSSNPQDLYVMGNNVFFVVEVGERYELWKSDLTNVGTIKLSQFGYVSSGNYETPSNFIAFHDKLVFSSTKPYSANYLTGVLWESDGTPEGTRSLDIPLFGPDNLFVYNNSFLFRASTQHIPPRSMSIWISDGTMTNTRLVKDNQIGAQGIDTKPPVKIGQNVYYSLNSGLGLWVTNGTSGGTLKASNYNANNNNGIVNYKGTLLFEDGQFLKSDGTVQSIKVPSGGYIAGPVTIVGDYIFYVNSDYKVYGVNGLYGTPQLLTFAGLSNPTVIDMKTQDGILFINENNGGYRYTPGDASAVLISESIREVTSFNNNVYYVDFWNRLCKINGGTQQQLTFTNDKLNQLTPCNNFLYFFAQENGSSLSAALWKYDGTNVTKVKAEIFPTKMIAANGLLFFTIKTDANGYELWKSDGSNGGTVMVKEINPGSTSAYPDEFFKWNDILYFSASDPQYGNELWRTDGSSTGTSLVADINPGASSSYPKSIRAIDNALIILASHPDYGQELWRVELSSPNIPQNFGAVATSNAITLNWSSDDVLVTRFEILRSTSLNGEFIKTGEVNSGIYSYSDHSVQTGITYYYTVRAVYAAGGNSPLSTIAFAKVGNVTAVVESTSDHAFELFPNPATDMLYIKLFEQANQLEVIDMVGNSCLLFDQNLETNQLLQLNISSLKSGFYFLKAVGENQHSTLKFIKR